VHRETQRLSRLAPRISSWKIAANPPIGGWRGQSPNRPWGLFASHLDLGGAENPRSRYLRCDQECRNNGWHANQSEKLIHRKHLSSPQDDFKSRAQKARSIRALRGLLIPCQKLVRVGRPGNREQRQNRNDGQCLHAVMVVFDCGQKCQSMAHFRDEQEKHRGRVSPCPGQRRLQNETARSLFGPAKWRLFDDLIGPQQQIRPRPRQHDEPGYRDRQAEGLAARSKLLPNRW
jgi:hypothetical protein